MVVDEPLEDMFEVINQGGKKRVSEMIALKHSIDQVWDNVNRLLIRINSDMKLSPFKSDTTFGVDKESFSILKANLGLRHEAYYDKLNKMKNALIKRAKQSESELMYKIEISKITEHFKSKKVNIAKRKILMMKERYKSEKHSNDLKILLIRANFLLRDYLSVLNVIHHLPEDTNFEEEKALYLIKCWYNLEVYETLWEWGKEFDFSVFKGEDKNLAIWLVMESGFLLGIDTDFSKFLEPVEVGAPYHLHIMHTLARSYLKSHKPEIAISVLETALEKKPALDIDKTAYNRILLTHAQVLFETGEYRSALDRFFILLNNDYYFEEALYGIAWCYIKLGMYQKAGTTLRKLINQSPQSARAAEAIQIMSMRLVNKAQYEWDKVTYLAKDEKQINQILKKLSEKFRSEENPKKIKQYKAAYKKINKLFMQLKEEKKQDYTAINSMYQEALNICELIATYYETGSFQEIRLSDKREKTLFKLDSLLITIKNKGKGDQEAEHFTSKHRENIQTIKKLVDKSFVRSAEILLALYKWQGEHLDWQKLQLSEKQKQLDKQYKYETDPKSQQVYMQEKNKILSQVDSLVLESVKLDKYRHNKLSVIITQLLETPLDPSDEVYLRYHLGELEYKNENKEFNRSFYQFENKVDQYDSLLALYNDGKLSEMPEPPAAPFLKHEKSMKQYQAALAEYPDLKDEFIAANRYSLAWCYNDLGLYDSAVSQMSRVAYDFKQSPFAPQAWMYLGESYFDRGQLDSAAHAYQSVMKYPKSEWFDDALYKLAWTEYRNSNPEKAISSFLAVVDLGKDKKAGKALLENESIDYIAVSFSETDLMSDKGLKKAVTFCQKQGDSQKGSQILHRLGDIYEKQGKDKLAVKSYNKLMDMYPLYTKVPAVESSLIKIEGKNLTRDQINKLKIDLFHRYNSKGKWARKQSDPAAVRFADSIAANELYESAINYHQTALLKNDRHSYTKAMKTYKEYVKFYPASPLTNKCHYNFAEILFSIGEYYEAAEEYIVVSKKYPDSEYKETAAWNAIVASQNLLKQEGDMHK
jgi:tetratricopeptide (TPR) repeat protein